MFLGWITGMHPPGKILACVTAGEVLLHKLRAHVAGYRAMKAAPGGAALSVGLVHHHITFIATGPRLLRGLARCVLLARGLVFVVVVCARVFCCCC